MARRRRTKKTTYSGRDYKTSIARRSRLPRLSSNTQKTIIAQLSGVDDRHHFPEFIRSRRPQMTIFGTTSPVRTTVRTKRNRRLYHVNRFVRPSITAPCVRRKKRREVIFASGRGGRKLGTRRVRRNASSSISCI